MNQFDVEEAWYRDVSFVEVEHASIAVRRFGSGPPLVLIPGFPLHGLTFRQVLPKLAEYQTCYVVDMPGTGDSRWSEATDFSFPAQARSLHQAMKQLGVPEYSVMAHDTGGSIARHLALANRRGIDRMVLMNTEIPYHRPPWIPVYGRLLGLPASTRLLRVLLRSRRFLHSRAGFAGCFHDEALLDGAFREHFIQPIVKSERRAKGYAAYLRGFDWEENDRMSNAHREIRASVLFLWGKEDPTFPEALGRQMANQFPRCAGFESIAEARLLVHEEQADTVAERAVRFLTDRKNGTRNAESGRPRWEAPGAEKPE